MKIQMLSGKRVVEKKREFEMYLVGNFFKNVAIPYAVSVPGLAMKCK